MEQEYNTLRENNTWTLVEKPQDVKVLTNRWVFKTKINQKGEVEKYKARLVARGHVQEHGVDYEEVFAPVARYETIRALLAAAVNEEMYVHQMDVISAYVQGELHDEVYMTQPEMFVERGNEDKVCRLLKPLYGLKQSGREWYKKLNSYLVENGGECTPADPCVYVFGKGENRVIIIIYVDDLILASKTLQKLESIKAKLKSAFKMVDLGQISNILGINVHREGDIGPIHLSQEKYVVELLKKFNMEDSKTVSTPIESNFKVTKDMCPASEDEKREMSSKPYRELVGCLVYLANATRPDIAFAANVLSRFCANPGKTHWLIAKRILRYLKATRKFRITYVKDNKKVKAYTDSDWAGDADDRKSCSGNVITLAGGPISWKSRKQASIALSTMEAEYAALSEVARETVYIKRLFIHMGFIDYVKSPIDVFCDNQSAINLSKNAVYHKRSKHIDICFHYTRDLVEKGEIVIHYLQTDANPADIFTKSLTKFKHDCCVNMLKLGESVKTLDVITRSSIGGV